jgi:hypothetical protein
MKLSRFASTVFLPVVLLSIGCVQTRITDPERSGVEQLLLSSAADQAIMKMDFSFLSGRKVFVDRQFFESYEEEYVLGAIRDKMSREGALLMENSDAADIIVEARSGGLSTDSSSSIIGLPSTGVPVPLAGNVSTPEIALFKTQKQFSTAKFALLAYDRQSGRHVNSSGVVDGFAHHHYYTVLGFFKFNSTSIPEKEAHAAKELDEKHLINPGLQTGVAVPEPKQ